MFSGYHCTLCTMYILDLHKKKRRKKQTIYTVQSHVVVLHLNSKHLRYKNCISWCRHFSYYFIIRHLSIHSFSLISTKITISKYFSTLAYFSINYTVTRYASDVPTSSARNYIASACRCFFKIQNFKVFFCELANRFQSINERFNFFLLVETWFRYPFKRFFNLKDMYSLP